MARGFSRLILPPDYSRLFSPRFGVGEVRSEPEVKGEVGWGPDFGGMISLDLGQE